METETTVYDYAVLVHRVLLVPNVILGIGIIPAMVILILTIVLMNLVSIWCVIIGIILFVVAKILCKDDPYMLTILFDRLMQPNVWRAR
ncbi:VirB3 family type IV secretion system protein [Treponema sp. Marseille-Q4523]|jgi:hypothetical protein|uniref:VirB3 family type IV secretion system protein n=1 Tax=Treponema sp. Marseille-Q4523 TaxID=2810610 RepID=UPI00195F9F61|nr:VirB3 family type IV secretion system protein [Treponema sp. Marseille-Q4523]MBM7022640.1 VirB3 family type IV secretion system protein [Treponema sp. Marseille-Q4523]